MSAFDTLDHSTTEVPTYARVLPIVSLCWSILLLAISIATSFIALFAEDRYSSRSVLTVLAIGLPLSLFGSTLLAFLPAVCLWFFVHDRRVTWAVRISGLSAIIGCFATALYLVIGYVG